MTPGQSTWYMQALRDLDGAVSRAPMVFTFFMGGLEVNKNRWAPGRWWVSLIHTRTKTCNITLTPQMALYFGSNLSNRNELFTTIYIFMCMWGSIANHHLVHKYCHNMTMSKCNNVKFPNFMKSLRTREHKVVRHFKLLQQQNKARRFSLQIFIWK